MPISYLINAAIFLSVIANFILAIIVLLNSKSKINLVFASICLMLGVWGLFLFLYGVPLIFTSYFWIKATYSLITFCIVLILAFSFIFPTLIYRRAWVFAAIYSVIFIIASQWLLFFDKDWIQKVVIDSQKGLQTIMGPTYIFWSIMIWIAFGWALFNFISNSRKSTGRAKQQLTYLFYGFGLWGIFVSIPDVVMPIFFKDTSYFSLSVITSLLFTGAVSYSIIKHRFMDIRSVVARAIAFSALLTFVGGVYAILAYLLSAYVLGIESTQSQLILNALVTIIIAFSFNRIRTLLERVTDRLFFRRQYDSEQLLSKLGTTMSTTIDLNALVSQVLQSLIDEMKMSHGIFVILGELSIYDTIVLKYDQKVVLTYTQLLPVLQKGDIFIFDELEEGVVKQFMRDLKLGLIRVLKVRNEVVGMLMLGDKSSGDIYSQQDLKVIEILVPEVSVAIQNSLSYDRIKKFNVILSEEVKKATGDLQKANDTLKQLDQLKDDFVSITSHELRTPMTAIRSYAWMALNRPDIPLSEKMKKYLSRTLASTERLINLVNDLLNLSRIEAGKVAITPKVFSIIDLTNEVLEEVKAKADEKGIQLLIMSGTVPTVFADEDKVHQVLLNLIGNSLKFTPHSGKIVIKFFVDGITVDTSVTDNGPGISREDQSRLFEKFGRLDSSYTAAATSGGSGLGLFICKSLIHLMHGQIWASSQGLGRGATFTFSLPIASKEVLSQPEKYHFKPQGEAKILEPEVINI